MNPSYRPMPRTLEGMQAIPLDVRAQFDPYQAQLFVAYQLRVGDHVVSADKLRNRGARVHGTVEAVYQDLQGRPVVVVGNHALAVDDLESPDVRRQGIWFLMPGDEVEALIDGAWQRRRVVKVDGRQWPTYKLEGSRRQFTPLQLRIPVSALAGVA